MSTPPKEEGPGLLSKVAKFVRNPMTNWADLDKPVPDSESGYSKQALKEMIERKRRNDFVRKREFDQLRKLRNRAAGAPLEGEQARPSFYQSSISSNLDERAHTLKKIDEIEAQMSKQWWKGKQAQGGGGAEQNFPVSGLPTKPPGASGEFEETKPASAPTGGDFEKTALAPPDDSKDKASSASSQAETRPPADLPSGFSTSKLFSVELSDEATDPELEEASIRFANGDDAGAEAGLRGALEQNAESEFAGVWIAALFDLYRATGQQNKFDALALDAAARYGRSPPPWLSMKEPLAEASEGPKTAPQGLTSQPLWEAPATLTLQSVGDLHLALANAKMPWLISWTSLKEIQPEAVKMLAGLFAQWISQPVRLRFDGEDHLERVLRGYTVAGNKSANNAWWRLRMDALRVMGRQDDFELAALDYCVTYEVSPPAWTDPQCEYASAGSQDPANAMSGSVQAYSDDGESHGSPSHTVPMGLDGLPGTVVALTGEIRGDAAEFLQQLEASRSQGQGRLVVSCAQLIRVDFSAAGSILNWVASRQEEGLQVQFRDVHRLVGAFFNVIGINEHAKVVLRAN